MDTVVESAEGDQFFTCSEPFLAKTGKNPSRLEAAPTGCRMQD
jgi:hypothetical protein